jgi:hypothetical protein
MQDFNQEYYFIVEEINEHNPSLTPDEDTANRPFEYEELPLGSKPLIFHDGALDWKKRKNIKPLNTPPEILFSGTDVVVPGALRETLFKLDIPHLAIQPAIYIDYKDDWYEDYWYLTFTELFDCWDRKLSKYEKEPLVVGNVALFDINEYSLNNELLSKTPLQNRLLFKMGGTSPAPVLAHASVARYFHRSGAIVLPIAEYGVSYP